MPKNDPCVVVPWVYDEERAKFLKAWGITAIPEWLVLQQDATKDGCGVTKNKGIAAAVGRGAEMVVVLDSDCFPSAEVDSLEGLVSLHRKALEPQPVEMFQAVTSPRSRGTPYGELTTMMPVAASMGYWLQVPDYCAVRQLAFNTQPMEFLRTSIFGKYFALCGMNLAFRPHEWAPWHQFINVDRFDDIWQGFLWQKEAYRRGYCFNLNGPLITHSRQSNVWKNLQLEAIHLEANETLWKKIAMSQDIAYYQLRKLLPV